MENPYKINEMKNHWTLQGHLKISRYFVSALFHLPYLAGKLSGSQTLAAAESTRGLLKHTDCWSPLQSF